MLYGIIILSYFIQRRKLMSETKANLAFEQLKANADKIYQLIHQQKSHLCIAKCPAFEEVVDTQLFGLSKQVEYAVAIGVVNANEGHKLMADLEYALNEVYSDVYEKNWQS